MVRSKRQRVSKPVEEEKSILQTWASTVCEDRGWARHRRSGQNFNKHWWYTYILYMLWWSVCLFVTKGVILRWSELYCEDRVWARPRRSGQDYNKHWWWWWWGWWKECACGCHCRSDEVSKIKMTVKTVRIKIYHIINLFWIFKRTIHTDMEAPFEKMLQLWNIISIECVVEK